MNFLVKESLYLLDYNNNIKDVLFVSTDKRTPGYAYEINIKDYNTGYSDLTFKMPGDIVTEDGQIIKNPKLSLLVPLSKVRYNRTVRYMGKEKISVPEPDGTVITYPKGDGTKPEDYLLEDYTMDYIVQPLDKSRQGIGINLTYTAIDYPRFNLSKKKIGLTFNNNTITTQELSLYKNEPLSVPGSVQYIPWDIELAKSYQAIGQVQTAANLTSQNANTYDIYFVQDTKELYQKQENGSWTQVTDDEVKNWSPNAQAKTYPLSENSIKKLVNETIFSYGILATIFYWPVTEDGRFEGVWYDKGGFITLSLYNTYEGSNWEGSDYLDSITWEWGHLDPIEHYLSPNNACNYLRYILKDTNWSVKGDKKQFVINTELQPWFDKNTAPSGEQAEGNYYIVYYNEEDKNIIEIYRYENNEWVNKTGNTFEQIVNTDIKDPDFGTLYDIDIEQVEVSRTKEASVGQTLLTDARYDLSVSNSNCYNAITSESKLFDLYPIFDSVDHTVSLKLNVGKDYGLSYRYKSNIKSSSVKADGEKVITKLYVTGGTDAQGDQNITIGEADRIISGISPTLDSESIKNYSDTSIKQNIINLEQNAYEHKNGIAITNGVDMTNKKFLLSFPDNLYEVDRDKATTNLITFSSGINITKLYNPTGDDYCYYVYINDGADAWKDEAKQLYKFDNSNITLRRNLTEYIYPNIGTITTVNNSDIETSSYIKYVPELNDGIVYENGIYLSSVTDEVNDGVYKLNDIEQNKDFVLVGPSRVYTIENKSDFHNYSVGNYYFDKTDNTYNYCAKMITDNDSIYSKINNISINGYIFINMGTLSDELHINVNGVNMPLVKEDGNNLTLQEWFVNNFTVRVIYDGTVLKVYDNFNPNAEEYLVNRTPYGTSYIYNFKYLYDNNWITKEEILDIYSINKEINDLNLDFYERYTKDLVNAQAAYNDAVNNYDIYSSKADAQLEALMSQYWVNPNKASDGHFSAFPGLPADVNTTDFDETKNKYYKDITYDEPQGDGTTKELIVKRVYFDIFGSTSCIENYPNAQDNNTTSKNPSTEGQYHVVANALGWENYYTEKLSINKEIGGYTQSQDPSNTAESYNKFIKQMKEYYYKALKAEEQMTETEKTIEEISELYKGWQEQVASYERELQEKYGAFIIEGSYSNTEQPYANLLIDDGLEASDKYSTPDITYTIGVVDSSGLIEYRAPQTIICNQLVKRLHNIGQIVPRVGDYVSIQDEPMGMFGVPGLITQISRRIDDPYQNSITIDTSYTDADELVGNIITATNTVLNNKDIYGRAAIINNKGELSSTTVSNALSTGTNSINIVSTSGKVSVDDNGLTCINPSNTDHVMRYNGTGILGSSNAGATWRELLTQDGINANYINAGTINASKVSITDGGHDITVVNSDGLVVKSLPNKPYVLGTLNSNGISKAFENVTVFVGRDANGNGVGYFNGYINASKGGNIGGWSISPNKLYSGSGSNYVALGTGSDGYRFWAGSESASSAPFYVKSDGFLKAKNADIEGTITSNNVTITGGSLKIGSNFAVDNAGNLTAKNANISGTINTTNLTASGTVTINDAKINSATLTNCSISAGQITSGVLNSARIPNLDAGKITTGTLVGRTIECGNSYIQGDGNSFQFTNNTAWLSMNVVSTHPYASSLNVNGINGISIRSRDSSVTDAKEQKAQINYQTVKNTGALTFTLNDKDDTIAIKRPDGEWIGINYDFHVKASPGYADFVLVVRNGIIVGGKPE